MIVGGLLLPSIGGGVCQTATTLFNDAFELGLPILERHNHTSTSRTTRWAATRRFVGRARLPVPQRPSEQAS